VGGGVCRIALAASAFIYTQLTDVEQEINGLLTYDRAVVKMDLGIVAAANQGQLPPMPPKPAEAGGGLKR
jgi:hypothetical protein